MNKYIVHCLNGSVFDSKIYHIGANTPKQAAEKAVGRKVHRVTSGGGNIVVYAMYNINGGTVVKSFVYEIE